jgi:hypothetical protein
LSSAGSHSPQFTVSELPTAQDYPGNNINTTGAGVTNSEVCGVSEAYVEDATACEARCNAAAVCAGFVHDAGRNCCYIKNTLANPTFNTTTATHLKTGELQRTEILMSCVIWAASRGFWVLGLRSLHFTNLGAGADSRTMHRECVYVYAPPWATWMRLSLLRVTVWFRIQQWGKHGFSDRTKLIGQGFMPGLVCFSANVCRRASLFGNGVLTRVFAEFDRLFHIVQAIFLHAPDTTSSTDR